MVYKKFYELEIRQESKSLAIDIYKILERGKIQKDYGLKDQIKRSIISVSSNIAEGCGRGGKEQFKYFLKVARGSCSEVHSQLIIAQELGVLSENIDSLIDRLEVLGKRISSLLARLKS